MAHAAGEGARLVVDPVLFDFHAPQPVAGRRADIAVVSVADRHQPLADIGAGRNRHPQAIGGVLVDETPVGAHEEAALRLAHAREVPILAIAHVVLDDAGGGHQPGREAGKQGGLAGTGFSDDGEHFARIKFEGDVAAADAASIEFRDVTDFQKRHGAHSAAS